MNEINTKPAWWPVNPYISNLDWSRKSLHEQIWESSSDGIFEAYKKHLNFVSGKGK